MTDFSSSPVTETLKPCPFCGVANAELEFGPEHRHWPAVRCNECGTLGPSIKLKHDEAVALWNDRSSGHAQTPAVPDRDQIARIINPPVFYQGYVDFYPDRSTVEQFEAFQKADAIIALSVSSTAGNSKTGA
jgi:Lar family restriction alleviation protein